MSVPCVDYSGPELRIDSRGAQHTGDDPHQRVQSRSGADGWRSVSRSRVHGSSRRRRGHGRGDVARRHATGRGSSRGVTTRSLAPRPAGRDFRALLHYHTGPRVNRNALTHRLTDSQTHSIHLPSFIHGGSFVTGSFVTSLERASALNNS